MTMACTYQIHVFGKPGCDKCTILNDRLDALLKADEWADFEKVYHNLETEAGLVELCEAECLNPQRVPGFYVSKVNPDTGAHEPLPNPTPGAPDAPGGSSALYTWVGLQTDYTPVGRGVITPRMITAVLQQARAL